MYILKQNELDRTENTQPALYTHALAIQEVLRQELELDLTTKKPCVSSVLGHSVGEFSALGAAGVFESIGQGAKLLVNIGTVVVVMLVQAINRDMFNIRAEITRESDAARCRRRATKM